MLCGPVSLAEEAGAGWNKLIACQEHQSHIY